MDSWTFLINSCFVTYVLISKDIHLHWSKPKSCTNRQLYLSLYYMTEKVRTIILYKDYFSDFFDKQRQKVKDKILWTFRIIETQKKVPTTYLKYMIGTDGLFEMRVQSWSDIFRIFCFFDEGSLIVLANGFHKKSRKTPKTEIDKALKIKKEYEDEK